MLGSIATDHIFRVEGLPHQGQRVFGELISHRHGGMALNQAVEVARYTPRVEIIGRVGHDPEANEIRAALRVRNVGTRLLITDRRAATGQSMMCLLGDDYYSVVAPGANARLTARDAVSGVRSLGSGRLLLSLEVPIGAVVAALTTARRLGIETVLVASPPEVCTPELLRGATWVIVNRREAQLLFGLNAQSLHETALEVRAIQHSRRIVVTLGADGAVVRDGDRTWSAHALPVIATNSVGAGDAFAGAFVAAICDDTDLERALHIACVAGALAVSTPRPAQSKQSVSQVMRLVARNYPGQFKESRK